MFQDITKVTRIALSSGKVFAVIPGTFTQTGDWFTFEYRVRGNYSLVERGSVRADQIVSVQESVE